MRFIFKTIQLLPKWNQKVGSITPLVKGGGGGYRAQLGAEITCSWLNLAYNMSLSSPQIIGRERDWATAAREFRSLSPPAAG